MVTIFVIHDFLIIWYFVCHTNRISSHYFLILILNALHDYILYIFCHVVQTMCSGRISLGRWSAAWTVRGEYVTFIVSGSVSQSPTGAYLAIGFSDSRSMVRLVYDISFTA